jgi:hypothetical protein
MMKKSGICGIAGPYDAFHLIIIVTPRYLAIDQGTIVPMIENYQGWLWKLFMNAPEVKPGLVKLGFHQEIQFLRND